MRNFEGRITCKDCGGRGFIEVKINMDEFVSLVEGPLTIGDKIPAIKEVRTRWGIGLKDAKEMVEAYQYFLNSMSTIVERE